MKEYTRPEFYVTQFEANEMIAACKPFFEEAGKDDTLTLTCRDCGVKATLVIGQNNGDHYVTTSESKDQNGMTIAGGQLWYDAQPGDIYQGSLYAGGPAGHEPSTTTANPSYGDGCINSIVPSYNSSMYHHHVGRWAINQS